VSLELKDSMKRKKNFEKKHCSAVTVITEKRFRSEHSPSPLLHPSTHPSSGRPVSVVVSFTRARLRFATTVFEPPTGSFVAVLTCSPLYLLFNGDVRAAESS
jgi:hypothetical protein